MSTQTFEEKVRSMSAPEIIMAMVEGLKNPKVKLDMDSFGHEVDGICFGCVATNTVCQISSKTFTASSIDPWFKQAEFLGARPDFLKAFEMAIDWLRKGAVDGYNEQADRWNFPAIQDDEDIDLPRLEDYYTLDDLNPYIALAEAQEDAHDGR